ncbi:MAG: LON peptidase substrate-binding domain-containing protein [Acetobacteraceae bacterium]|nr:LON peptidase substrate-binding domain-containing protein [Acetobacteraceae bacterium]
MAAFHPSPRDLPAEFAIFPLPEAVLLPRGRLPLNIFEPRYLAMTEDALGARRMFGMIQPDTSLPAGPHGPGLYRVGCLGRISSFSETDDGRFLITLTGLIRFTVADEVEMRRGYRRVRSDYDRFLHDLDEPPEAASIDRELLLTELRRYFARRGIGVNWEAINKLPDQMLVVTLAMVCPFDPAEKQALLEALTLTDQARVLRALLQMGGLPASGTVAS